MSSDSEEEGEDGGGSLGCWDVNKCCRLTGICLTLTVALQVIFGEQMPLKLHLFLLAIPLALGLINIACCLSDTHEVNEAIEATDDNDSSTLCPLCKAVQLSTCQASRAHRYVCAKHHSAILMTLPVVYDEVRCPSCSQPLRVWPPDRSPTFSCAGCSGHHGARANSGCNLFRCFGCGYDLCLDCVKGWRREQALFLERQRLITDAERRSPPSAPASAPQNPTSNRGRSVTPPPSYQSALAMQPPIEDESGSKQGPLNV